MACTLRVQTSFVARWSARPKQDVSATAISIVISALNGVDQRAGQVPVAEASSQTHLISNNAMILFTMTMEATTNFLHQIALSPLYAHIAMQKIYVCSANSILAVARQNQLAMTIGDPSIQSFSDIGAGRCMTQYFAENTQSSLYARLEFVCLLAFVL